MHNPMSIGVWASGFLSILKVKKIYMLHTTRMLFINSTTITMAVLQTNNLLGSRIIVVTGGWVICTWMLVILMITTGKHCCTHMNIGVMIIDKK